jgi:putative transposase
VTQREDFSLTIDRTCHLASVSRASYYRAWQASAPHEAEAELRDRIQRISLEHRAYGSRRITETLRAEGLILNRKRVQRLMRLDNLLALRKRRFVTTTDSRHTYAVFPNLARGFEPTGPNQLWVADITFIRLREGFVFLAVVLDAWSRRVVGWALDDTLEASLPLAALRHALADRVIADGLIHHSDRGSQYCSREYVAMLAEAGVRISMSRAGNPYDNAQAESFMRTLKCEEVTLRDYRDLDDARERIGEFLEGYYNRKRLHSALGYRTPAAFEEARA